MTKHEANKILNKIRCGDLHPTSTEFITKLLHITGDLGAYAGLRSEGVDNEIQPQDWRARVRERAILVGRSKE